MKFRRYLSTSLIISLLFIVAWMFYGSMRVTATELADDSAFVVNELSPTVSRLTPGEHDAIIQALAVEHDAGLASEPAVETERFGTLTVTAIQRYTTWAIVTIAPVKVEIESLDLNQLQYVLLVKTAAGWEGATYASSRFSMLVNQVPATDLNPDTVEAIFSPTPVDAAQGGQQFFEYKLPFRNKEWQLSPSRQSNGWHGSTPPSPFQVNHALDFTRIDQKPGQVFAMASGTLTVACQDEQQYYLTITTQGLTEKIGYLHLSKASVAAAFPEGIPSYVQQGTLLGETQNGNFSRACGIQYGAHLHLWLPAKPFIIDGITFSESPDSLPRGPLASTQEIPSPPTTSESPPVLQHFPDVPPTHPNFEYIETLYYLGAVNGYSDGNFHPTDDLTRGQAAKIIIIALNSQYLEDETLPQPFADVPASHTFYLYIMRLRDLGITNGDSNGNFLPDASITRGQMTKFIVLAYDGEEPEYNDCVAVFSDVPCSDTFYSHIRRLKEIFDEADIQLGYSDGTFRPNEALTREGAAKYAVVGLGLLPSFPDVPYYHPFFREINILHQRGVIGGYSDGTFRPDEPVLREQATKFVVRALGLEPDPSDFPTPSFPDVNQSNSFYPYIEYLAHNNVINGYSDGEFKPTLPLTRAAAATVIVNTLAEIWNVTCENTGPNFPDVPPSNPHYDAIRCLRELGITTGYSDGGYHPDEEMTRGGFAKFVVRAFGDYTAQIDQESTDTANNTVTSAPDYQMGQRYIVTGSDQDHIRFEVSPTLDTTYLQVQTVNLGTNMDVALQIVDSNNNVLASAARVGTESEVNLLWQPAASGDYYVRLTNQNAYATEGSHLVLSITTTVLTESVYLPLIQ